MNNPYENAANALRNAHCAVAVTGAGISVESGIPSFRGATGIWVKYPVEEFATIEAFLANPSKVWRFWRELGATLHDCKPNPAHRALAEIENLGILKAVITQNIDNLHEEAGSAKVIEYHGNAHWIACMECGRREPLDVNAFPEHVPYCDCGGVMKPDVVMFGEMIPERALIESEQLTRRCDVMLVVGTSAQVFPAAQLPFSAKQRGAFIIEANTERTAFTRNITDAFLEGPAGETLPELLRYMKV